MMWCSRYRNSVKCGQSEIRVSGAPAIKGQEKRPQDAVMKCLEVRRPETRGPDMNCEPVREML